MNIAKKIIVVIIILTITVFLLGFLWLWFVFGGGVQGIINNLTPVPDPQKTAIVNKRGTARENINSYFTDIENNVGFKTYATATHDRCYKGDSNYMRSDGYAYKCTYRITKIYGFNNNFRQEMIDFEEKLLGSGWKTPYPPDHPIKEILEEKYDVYYGTEKGKKDYPMGYYISNLATPYNYYEKNGAKLEIEYAERAKKDIFQMEYSLSVNNDTSDEIYDEKSFPDISAVFDQITSENNFVLEISIQKDYFEN